MKKRCSSSRGPSHDENEEAMQDLASMVIHDSHKAVTKSPEFLLYCEYFKDIPAMPEEAFSNILGQNGIFYNFKDKRTSSPMLSFKYKDTTLESMDLEVTWGCYQTHISIFIMNMLHVFCGERQPFAEGTFGQVNFIRFENK